jgi:hypothetical protein
MLLSHVYKLVQHCAHTDTDKQYSDTCIFGRCDINSSVLKGGQEIRDDKVE